MHFSSAAIILFAAQLAVAAPNACNANNCLREVVASAFTTRHGSADCSSFFSKTVTPATSTVTSTVVVTSIVPNKRDAIPASAPALAPRQVTAAPSSIPAYASACSGTAGYSSACSCIGVTETTTTLPTPTTTVTVTSTTIVSPSACPTFALRLANSNVEHDNTLLDGTYATIGGPTAGDINNSGIVGDILFNGTDLSGAANFSLDAAGHLYTRYAALIASADPNPFSLFHFDMFPYAYSGQAPALCSIAGGALTCETLTGVNVLQVRGATDIYLYIGDVVEGDCVQVTLEVVCR